MLYSNSGRPQEAVSYVCEHGHGMETCTVGDDNHRQTGILMLEWYNNNTFLQQRERIDSRNRLLNGD